MKKTKLNKVHFFLSVILVGICLIFIQSCRQDLIKDETVYKRDDLFTSLSEAKSIAENINYCVFFNSEINTQLKSSNINKLRPVKDSLTIID